ncbi:MAG: complex I subunit 5 family protein [Gammaproteobacteria bacterium]
MSGLSAHAAAWAIALPAAGAALALVVGNRAARLWVPLLVSAIVASVATLSVELVAYGPLRYPLGGWGVPLGIELYADGLSVLMLWMTALVSGVVSLYSLAYWPRAAAPAGFWSLWLFLWAALNALFLSGDIFNLYVTLELLTLAGVGLVVLAGDAAIPAALRYLIAAVLASLGYLLGVALLYGAHGTLDLAMLAERIKPGPLAWSALALMTISLALKSALFPLHFWLPPAHAAAPAPVSAALSALVVKAAFYLVWRLWFQPFGGLALDGGAQLLGALGAAAVVWGSWQALRAERLKLLIAHSTVAQVGYLFLLFPLAAGGAVVLAADGALLHMLSHAFAKAALFLAAGVAIHALGHDRIGGLGDLTRRFPLTLFAMGLAGTSLMGLPPSGGFVGKWLLLQAVLAAGQWWWVAVLIGGGLLTAAYLFRVFRVMFVAPSGAAVARVPLAMEVGALVLALLALALGFAAELPLSLFRIGAPWHD